MRLFVYKCSVDFQVVSCTNSYNAKMMKIGPKRYEIDAETTEKWENSLNEGNSGVLVL